MTARSPLLMSIVVPARNEELLLDACLASLRQQSYDGDYEIIVVDNGSTDRTPEIARAHGVRLVRCERAGVLFARRAGAMAAQGEVIAQADADTVYPRDWLARVALELTAHTEVVAVAGGFVYTDPPYWARIEYAVRAVANRLTSRLLGEVLCVYGANFAFRRSALELAGGYRSHPISGDQWGLAHRLRALGRIRYVHGLVVSTSARRVRKQALLVLAEALRNCSQALAHFAAYVIRSLHPLSSLFAARRRLATAVPVAVVIALAVYGYAIPTSQVFGRVYSREKTNERLIALTFDDGPNEPYTSQILDILASTMCRRLSS